MKKGESALTFVASLIFLSVTLLIFYALFLQSAANKSEFYIKEIAANDVYINLINYLHYPAEDLDIYELIVKSYYSNDYKKLEEITKNRLNEIYDKERCPLWKITGEIEDKKIFDYESEFDIRKYTLKSSPRNLFLLFNKNKLITKSSSLELLLPEKNKNIKINLEEGCVNE